MRRIMNLICERWIKNLTIDCFSTDGTVFYICLIVLEPSIFAKDNDLDRGRTIFIYETVEMNAIFFVTFKLKNWVSFLQ